MNAVKKFILRHWRTGLQILFFLYAPAAFSAAFGGVKAVFARIGSGEPLSLSPMIQLFLGIVVSVMLFGRFFCGAACAFGSLGDWLYALSAHLQKKTRRRLPRLSAGVERRLAYLKYAVLCALLALCVTGNQGAISGKSPRDAFAMALALRLRWTGNEVAWILLGAILLGMLWIPRFFCRFLCPLGAIFSLVPQFGIVRIRKQRSGCGACRACSSVCPARLPLGEYDDISSGECFSCGKCTQVCPRKNARYRLIGGARWPVVGLLLQAALLAALMYVTLVDPS